MISINYNPSVLRAQTNLARANKALNKALTRMSTGYKINSASDDAAGMYIASRINSQIRGLKQAQNNVNTGVAYLNIAEGSLSNITDVLNRMRDLAVQGSTGTIDSHSRTALQNEARALVEEISRIQSSSLFNDVNVFGYTAQQVQASAPASLDTVPDGYTAIYTVGDLKNIANDLTGNYILMNDIDMTGEIWTPIGDLNATVGFTGTLDGNGYVIKNLSTDIDRGGGLFALLGSQDGSATATVKNLGLDNINITGGQLGGLAAVSGYATISNCYVTGTITEREDANAFFAGGLIGTGAYNTIVNCYVDATVTSVAGYAGGFIAQGQNNTITNSYTKGIITGGVVGGLSGLSMQDTYNNVYTETKIINDGSGVGVIGNLMGYVNTLLPTMINVYYNSDKNTAINNIGQFAGVDGILLDTSGIHGLSSSGMSNSTNWSGLDELVWDTSTYPPTLKNMPRLGGMSNGAPALGGGGNTNNNGTIRLQIGTGSDSSTNALIIDLSLNLGTLNVDLTTEANSANSIGIIDNALKTVNQKISTVGAMQSRLSTILETQSIQIENFSATHSTIIDADIAEETGNYIQNQILQQTTSALLAQAQQLQTNLVLSLISSFN